MNPIRLPRVAAKMREFAEVETASHGRAVEIQQTKAAAIITAADGHQLCRITAPAAAGAVLEPVEPFLVDARDLGKAAAAQGLCELANLDGDRLDSGRTRDEHVALDIREVQTTGGGRLGGGGRLCGGRRPPSVT